MKSTKSTRTLSKKHSLIHKRYAEISYYKSFECAFFPFDAVGMPTAVEMHVLPRTIALHLHPYLII